MAWSATMRSAKALTGSDWLVVWASALLWISKALATATCLTKASVVGAAPAGADAVEGGVSAATAADAANRATSARQTAALIIGHSSTLERVVIVDLTGASPRSL